MAGNQFVRSAGRSALFGVSSVVALLAANPAFAQAGQADDAAAASADASQDIIVTAQKRTERLIEVPAAVTAIDSTTLAERQVNTAADLDKLSPSINIRQGTNPSSNDVRIRGVGTSVFSAGVEPSVSFVLDGVVQARQSQGFGDLADVERMEVLRGPQGTLFGKNATAGVINIVTKRPSRDFEGSAEFTIAELDEYRAKATLSGPLTDTMGVRVSGYYNNVGGHIYDTTLDRKINGYESYGVRAKLEWDATPNLNLLLSGEYSENNGECCQLVYVKVVNPSLAGLLAPIVGGENNRQTPANRPYTTDTKQWQTALEANLDLGAVSLTSITAYQYFDRFNGGDVDGLDTTRPIFLAGQISALDFNDGTDTIKQFSQELRVASNGSGPIKFVAGAFYLNLDLDSTFYRQIATCVPGGANGPLEIGQACAAPVYRSTGLVANVQTENVAAFGQVEAKLVGGLSAIGGIRVQYERNSYSGTRTSPFNPGDLILNAPSSGSGKTSDTAVTGKAGLQYEFSRDAQIYGTYSRGYKGAAYGVQLAANFVNQAPVRPETVDAFELGFKFQTEDRTFSLNSALFYQKYNDLQVQANRSDVTTTPPTINNVLTNAGTATVKGLELEAVIRPVSQFQVRAGVTLLDTELNIDGLNCPLQFQAAAPVITANQPANACFRLAPGGATQQNVRNGKLPNSSDVRVTLSARYEDEIASSGLRGFVQVGASFQSDYNFAIEQDPEQLQDAYTIVDASMGVMTADQRYRLTLFVKNLFNEHYIGFAGNASVLTSATVTPTNQYGIVPKDANRYFGASVGISF